MLNIIFYAFIGVVAIQLFYYGGIFSKFAFAKPKTITPKKIPVSVIVCAKNEAEKVREFVPLLATQDYPDYEIVLIDDASSDETLDIFEAFEKQYSNIRLVKVENNEAFWGNKKFALTLGIKAARKEYLLFTDADCYPADKYWIASMSSQFTMSKTIILGYGAYERVKNSFLNKIIRFDNMLTATQYFSWAKAGMPFMGEGRNMAYKREEFFKVNGYIDHMNIRSGEDSLFINRAATKKNTTLCYAPGSFTYSEPKHKFRDWFMQKRRGAFTASFFRPLHKSLLRLFFLSQLLFIILAILLAVLQFSWMLLVPVIAFRYIFSWITMGYSASKLNEKDTVYWYPVIEIILIFTQLNVFFTNLFSKPVHWK
ncbi:glycosyl transferase family 2 [Flavobacterium cyanobacteriorum]|uniref:Glycosyl transferase family 2 n=1 Tax=Flavobacterium cyanobacteriorum TaxID=2022802 RepID=A0A255YRU0_9FLAO|nr:glycosyltransferase [Flavobacterium cyanobacteriorum]OYQ31927.1 glycosyl transferase family 2 [Flavobacterium cyanobacteriorum]